MHHPYRRGAGRRPPALARRDAPLTVFHVVPSLSAALKAIEAGVDGLVVEGGEGGGFKMGPFELMDLIGIDVNYAASKSVYEQYFGEARFRPSLLQQRMAESGRLGRKTGKGVYVYDEEGNRIG